MEYNMKYNMTVAFIFFFCFDLQVLLKLRFHNLVSHIESKIFENFFDNTEYEGHQNKVVQYNVVIPFILVCFNMY